MTEPAYLPLPGARVLLAAADPDDPDAGILIRKLTVLGITATGQVSVIDTEGPRMLDTLIDTARGNGLAVAVAWYHTDDWTHTTVKRSGYRIAVDRVQELLADQIPTPGDGTAPTPPPEGE
jgi:hypothetical protein